ncbi:hypothetical protein CKO09_06575 [Chromatium weissei]|nr:hypothetical protein [Chromatium weissei]
MSTKLLNSLDPWRAVRNELSLVGRVALTELTRLTAVVLAGTDDDTSQVQYQLHFARSHEGHKIVTGRVQARLRLPCQRCLGVVEMAIDVPLNLGLVTTEALAETLSIDLEPVIVIDDQISPLALIEDELLLAIPTIPRHDEGGCQAPAPASTNNKNQDANIAFDDVEKAPHPFAVLRGLKRDQEH